MRRRWGAVLVSGVAVVAACGGSSPVVAPASAPDPDRVVDAVLVFRDVQQRLLAGEDLDDAALAAVAVDGANDALDAARARAPLAVTALPAYDEQTIALLDGAAGDVSPAAAPLGATVRSAPEAARTEWGRVAAAARPGTAAVVCVRNPPGAAAGTTVGVLVTVTPGDGDRWRLAEFLPAPAGVGGGRPGVPLTTGSSPAEVACGPDGRPTAGPTAAGSADGEAAGSTAAGSAGTGSTDDEAADTASTAATTSPAARRSTTTTVADPAAVRAEVVAAVLAYRDVQRRILAGETVTEDDLVVGVGEGHHALEDLRGAPVRAEGDRPAYDADDLLVLEPAALAGIDPAALTGFGEVVTVALTRGRVAVVCVRNPPSSPDRVGTVVAAVVEVTNGGGGRPPQVGRFLEAGAGLDPATPGVAFTATVPLRGVRCPPDGPPAPVAG